VGGLGGDEPHQGRGSLRLILLGTGTSFGVPQIGCDCRTCTSTDPKDRRTRSAAVVEANGRRLLIDTPPELRLQLVQNGINDLDAVLFTHAHADHVHGIDDLRPISTRRKTSLPAYGPPAAIEELARRFDYIFDPSVEPPPGTSIPRLAPLPIPAGAPIDIAGVSVLPLHLPHGDTVVYGYRIGPIAYLTDAKSVPDDVRARLDGLEVLVLNALLPRPHPLHLSIPEAIATARAIGAKRTIFTHLTHERTHAELVAEFPEGIEPGFDGMVVDVS
jgi:phosphoribosyl 1,2-cyclic phosphate phosphodiesterase